MPSERAVGATAHVAAGRRVRPATNASYVAMANIASRALGFSLFLLAINLLGQERFGQYTAVTAFVGLYEIVTDLGLTGLMVRDVSAHPEQGGRYVTNILALRLVLSVTVIAAIVLLAPVYAPQLKNPIDLYALALIPLAATNTLQAVFQFAERQDYSAVFNVGTTVLRVGLSALVLLVGYHVLALTAVFTAVAVVGAGAMLVVVYTRFLPMQWSLDLRSWPGLLRRAVPFAMIVVLNILYTRADTQILSVLSHCGSNAQNCIPVARYGIATRVLDTLVAVFVGGIQAATLPLFSRVAVQARDRLVPLVRSSVTLMLILGCPVALFTTFFASEAIHVMSLRQVAAYLPAAPALAVIVWAFPCILVINIFFNALYAIQQQRIVTAAFAVNLVFNVGLNIALIPHFSFMASSALTVASEVLNGIIVLVAMRHYMGSLGVGVAVVKMLALSVVVATVLWLLHPLGIVMALPVGVVVLLLGLRAVRLVGPAEREILTTLPLVGRYAAFFS